MTRRSARPGKEELDTSMVVKVACQKCGRQLLSYRLFVEYEGDEQTGYQLVVDEAFWSPSDAAWEWTPAGQRKFRFGCRCGARPQVLETTIRKAGDVGMRVDLTV